MRDKRMTEFTGRQMVIRLAPTRRVLVGKDVTHSDAVHDASVYDMRRDADIETLRPLTSNVDAYSLMMQDVNDTNLYAAVGRCSEVFREMYRWAFRSYDSAFTVYRLPSSRAGFKLYMVLADGRIATKRVAVMMGWPVVRGRFILLPERVDVLAEIKAFISEDTTPRPLDKISVPLMTYREMEMLYAEIQRLVRWYNVQRTPVAKHVQGMLLGMRMLTHPSLCEHILPHVVRLNSHRIPADVKQLMRTPHTDYRPDGSMTVLAADNYDKAMAGNFSEVKIGRVLRKIFPHATQAVITRMVEKFNADNKGYKLELTKSTEEMCRIMREGAQMSSAAFPHTCMTTICLSIYDKEDYLPEWVHPYMAYDHALGWSMAMIKDDKGFVVGRAIVHTERMEFVRVFANGNNVVSSTFEKTLTLAGYKQVSGWYGLLLKRVPLSLERIDDMMTESIAAVVPYLDGEERYVEPAGEFLRITNNAGRKDCAGYCDANGWTIVEPVRCERCGGEHTRAMRVIVGEGVTQRWGWCCSHEMRSLPDRKYYDASILVEDEQQRNQYIPRWEWKRYNAQQVVELDDVQQHKAEPVAPAAPAPAAPAPAAPEPDDETLEQWAGQSHTPSPVMRGFLMECRGRLTQAEYNSVARLVDTLTPADDWLFIGHYTEMRRRLGRIDGNNNLVHEMRVVLATMRGDGWQDYNTVAREETSLPAAIERLANSTPISPMYGTRERPITLAYAEGYTLRGGTL